MKAIEISPYELTGNPFGLFDKQWCLITAGTEHHHNTMVTAWGGLGIAWNVPTAMLFVRPSRYTYEFLQKEESFSLSFFGVGNERSALRLLGYESGRHGNKIRHSGLSVQMFADVPAFAEAQTVLVCKKAYCQPMLPECLQAGFNTEAHYPYDGTPAEGDFHHFLMGAIQHVFVAE